MEKLELKHLTYYLPYGLKIRVRLNRFSCGAGGKMYTDKNVELTYKNILKFKHGVHYNSIKPILRPLSDLTKRIEIDGKFIPLERLLWESNFNIDIMSWDEKLEYLDVYTCIDLLTFKDIQLLCEWHFDIFGLIDKGLAISYSDVQSTSNDG